MQIKDLLEIQKELDKKIIETHKPSTESLRDKMILALFVEIAELANEIQSFKYWKINKNFSDENILEEFSDGIHFILSFYLYFKNVPLEINPNTEEKDINKQFNLVFELISKFKNSNDFQDLLNLFEVYLGIIKNLSYSDKQIKEAYISKNKKNLNRIKNKY